MTPIQEDLAKIHSALISGTWSHRGDLGGGVRTDALASLERVAKRLKAYEEAVGSLIDTWDKQQERVK
jgi:hypothetical protein